MKYLTILGLLLLSLRVSVARADVDHSLFDSLLRKHVDEQGMVNYKGFRKDEAELRRYLTLLSKNPPKAGWSAPEKLAYWINAYNAFTIQLILKHYPVKSIKDIGSTIQIPFVNTPWDVKFIRIGENEYDLNNIEHDIIRKQFNDPRIHFALVCAAKSCPRLRNEAYTAAKLNRQLDEQGRDFLNNPAKNAITSRQASLSKILDWYAGDFRKNGQSVVGWVNRYSTVKISNDTRLSYQTYDWSLNEQ